MKTTIQFQLNGQPTTLEADDESMLLWVLRTQLGLTGTKYGCGAGVCGACTVTVDGNAVRSCRTPRPECKRKSGRHHRGVGTWKQFAPAAASLY